MAPHIVRPELFWRRHEARRGMVGAAGLRAYSDASANPRTLQRAVNVFTGPNDRAKPKGQVFLGRGREVDDVSALMADWPLVTVVGPGGIGKTALAGQVAQRVAEDAGVAFAWCDLARLSPNDDVGASVSAWLGFSGLDALVEAHHNQEALIVLDNCEHVLDSAARTAERLVATGPLRIIATSRERLDLAHERVFALTALSAEASIELMRTRADQVGAPVQDFSDDALGRLCDQLDHLPLAIELAAARLRMLSPAELTGHLAGRLDLLTGGRSLPDRHRSLRAAIDWSYALLDPQGQRWFARLGIFDGPFSLEDAAAVCAEPSEDNVAVAHALERLVNVSLLVTVPRVRRDQGMEHTRYRLLESLRHFAQERLGARDELGPMRDRRVAHIVSVAGEILQAGMNAWDADVTERLFTSIDALCWATDVCIRIDDAPDRAILAYLPSWGVVHHSHAARLADLGDAFLDKWPPGCLSRRCGRRDGMRDGTPSPRPRRPGRIAVPRRAASGGNRHGRSGRSAPGAGPHRAASRRPRGRVGMD